MSKAFGITLAIAHQPACCGKCPLNKNRGKFVLEGQPCKMTDGLVVIEKRMSGDIQSICFLIDERRKSGIDVATAISFQNNQLPSLSLRGCGNAGCMMFGDRVGKAWSGTQIADRFS